MHSALLWADHQDPAAEAVRHEYPGCGFCESVTMVMAVWLILKGLRCHDVAATRQESQLDWHDR
jgi:hypothetical protein